jgi:hypothetical protein
VTFRYNSIGAPIPARCTSQSFDNGATLPIGSAGSEILCAAARAAESDNCRGGSPKSTAQANTQIWNNHAWKRKSPVRGAQPLGNWRMSCGADHFRDSRNL